MKRCQRVQLLRSEGIAETSALIVSQLHSCLLLVLIPLHDSILNLHYHAACFTRTEAILKLRDCFSNDVKTR